MKLFKGVGDPRIDRFHQRRRWVRRLGVAFYGLIFTGLLAGGALAAYIYYRHIQNLPDFTAIREYRPPVITRIYAKDGRLMGEFYAERRIEVPYSRLPRHLVLAFVAAEDARFFEHPGVDVFLINQTIKSYNNKSELAKNAPIHGMVSLQCVGAAQQRITEAMSYLSEANASFHSNDYLTALYKISYAQERIESVQWWLNICTQFHDSGAINTSMINTLAEEYLDDAQQGIIYSEMIINEMGQTSNYLNDAKSLLDAARSENENGFSAAALFGSFESLLKQILRWNLLKESPMIR